jgi:hypothetical protein
MRRLSALWLSFREEIFYREYFVMRSASRDGGACANLTARAPAGH